MSAPAAVLLALAVAAVGLFDAAVAANITVGAPNGQWDLSTDYQTWAASQTFRVGDNLVFRYTSGQHDVLEVSKNDYDSCIGDSAIQTWTTGDDTVPLTSTGTRYFICGITNHCDLGMKLQVNVQAATAATPPTPTSTPPPPPTTTTPTASAPPTPSSVLLPPPPPVAQGPAGAGGGSAPPPQSSTGVRAKVAVAGLGLGTLLALAV